MGFDSELIPLEAVLQLQNGRIPRFFELLTKILLRYGGSKIIVNNTIVNSSLVVLGTIFVQIPVTTFSAEVIYAVWMSVVYCLDSCLQTYSQGSQRVCLTPPNYGEGADNLLEPMNRDANEQSTITVTTELIVYLFCFLFLHPQVQEELTKDYALQTMIQLMDTSVDQYALLTMFFYAYGHAISKSRLDGGVRRRRGDEQDGVVAGGGSVYHDSFQRVRDGRRME